MRFVKRVLVCAGAIALAAALVNAFAPNAVHAAVAALVQVTNAVTNPVPIEAVDNPGLQPFQYDLYTQAGLFGFSVPTGKTLVIEHVSTACLSASNATGFFPTTTAGGVKAIYSFAPAAAGGNLVASQLTRVYADGGTFVSGGAPGGPNCEYAVSGHLVNHL